MNGKIININVSNGGVPKLPIESAYLGYFGFETDKQNDTLHHGGKDRAVVIYSFEKIYSLQQEGHPIFEGAIGENLTTVGLNFDELRIGSRLRIGQAVEIEITEYTTPCSTLKQYFINGDFTRVSEKINPTWSRLCAKVLKPGKVTTNDEITVV